MGAIYFDSQDDALNGVVRLNKNERKKQMKKRKNKGSKRVRATKSRKRGPVSNWKFTISDARRVGQHLAEEHAGQDWDELLGHDTAESLRRIVG